jgi:hypothetical protein
MPHAEVINPVAQKAIIRRAKWEAERVAKIWQMVEDGILTEDEAKVRLDLA